MRSYNGTRQKYFNLKNKNETVTKKSLREINYNVQHNSEYTRRRKHVP